MEDRSVVRFVLIAFLTSILAGCNNSGSSGSGDAAPSGVVLLRYLPGSESTEQREAGFLETLATEFPDINVISSSEYSGATPESAMDKAQQILLKYGDRTNGIFGVCEPNATGTLRALQEAGMSGTTFFVGFDPTERMVLALAEGDMHGIVLQDPVNMGYLAVKTMAAHLDGETVEKRISTGEHLATAENMNGEEMQRLLKPAQFSGDDFEPDETKYTIAVIPKGTTHEFWRSVHHGAHTAAEELGNVKIIWKGPLSEGDREGQINVVQDFITRKVDGICLAPLDARALVPVVDEAKAAGIPTVIYDSDLDDGGKLKISYVATDNFAGGALAARRIGTLLSKSTPAASDADAPVSPTAGAATTTSTAPSTDAE
jgi:ABC-type sugar transport system substrate-binding protein